AFADEGDYLLLPVGYDNGFTARVNGEQTECCRAFGIFTAVRLHAGDNHVSISFFPGGMKAGIIISVCTLLILGVYYVLTMRKQSNNEIQEVTQNKGSNTLNRILWYLFVLSWCALIIIFFIIPVLYAPYVLLFL
ncbi:MAG: YfhO family protein, partial [Clostridia bacterium]|nr:YfhO family protein [Clostridia bacterium]